MEKGQLSQPIRTLAELEGVIQRGFHSFVEVGMALMEIRDHRLYREQGFTSFERYCRTRWSFSRQRGHQLMSAAVVAANLSTTVDTGPNERQARELARLSPERQREIAADIDFRTATADEIRDRVVGSRPSSYFSLSLAMAAQVSFHTLYAYRDPVDQDRLARMTEGIRRVGQLVPILTMSDRRTIIDGRYRFLACIDAGIEPWFQTWEGGTSLEDIDELVLELHNWENYMDYEREKVLPWDETLRR